MRADRTAGHAGVVPGVSARSGDVRLAHAVIAVESLVISVSSGGNSDPASDFARRLDERAEEIAVAQIDTVIPQRRNGQNAVRARELRGSLHQDVIGMITGAIGLAVRLITVSRDVTTQAGGNDIEVFQASVNQRLIHPNERAPSRAVEHFAGNDGHVRRDTGNANTVDRSADRARRPGAVT